MPPDRFRNQDYGRAEQYHTPIVDTGWRIEPNATMMTLRVVPPEEGAAEDPSIQQTAEPVREIGSVLERLELAFRERFVVGYRGPAVTLAHAQVRRGRVVAVVRSSLSETARSSPCPLSQSRARYCLRYSDTEGLEVGTSHLGVISPL